MPNATFTTGGAPREGRVSVVRVVVTALLLCLVLAVTEEAEGAWEAGAVGELRAASARRVLDGRMHVLAMLEPPASPCGAGAREALRAAAEAYAGDADELAVVWARTDQLEGNITLLREEEMDAARTGGMWAPPAEPWSSARRSSRHPRACSACS